MVATVGDSRIRPLIPLQSVSDGVRACLHAYVHSLCYQCVKKRVQCSCVVYVNVTACTDFLAKLIGKDNPKDFLLKIIDQNFQ